MSLQDGTSSKEKYDPKKPLTPCDEKTQRPTANGNIGSKRGGATKK